MEWQPIETAPKDGREIIGAFTLPSWARRSEPVAATWWDGDRFYHTAVGSTIYAWMPLPDPPP